MLTICVKHTRGLRDILALASLLSPFFSVFSRDRAALGLARRAERSVQARCGALCSNLSTVSGICAARFFIYFFAHRFPPRVAVCAVCETEGVRAGSPPSSWS